MGQSINDASDLVSKRRKVPLTASLAARQAFQIRNLSHGFFDSLVPGMYIVLAPRFITCIFSNHIFCRSCTGAEILLLQQEIEDHGI